MGAPPGGGEGGLAAALRDLAPLQRPVDQPGHGGELAQSAEAGVGGVQGHGGRHDLRATGVRAGE